MKNNLNVGGLFSIHNCMVIDEEILRDKIDWVGYFCDLDLRRSLELRYMKHTTTFFHLAIVECVAACTLIQSVAIGIGPHI